MLPPMEAYDFTLPPERIAQEPAAQRDASRALFCERGADPIEPGQFRDLPSRLRGDECFVVNDTRVIPARLRARRATGGAIEVFLLRREEPGSWRCWLSPSRRLRDGERLEIDGGGPELGSAELTVVGRVGSFWRVRLDDEWVERHGEVPLPPYIARDEGDHRLTGLDRERYQTIFANTPGAVAAPTAGLHFTPDLREQILTLGIPIVPVTLHVGPGTFKPVTAERLEDHRVDPELYRVSAESRRQLAQARRDGRRIISVGTTSLRVLESLDALDDGEDLEGETSLTILPGHNFKHVDGLITNFHLPRSSLLVLVCAFHGESRTLAAYGQAIASGLRFYSYGDAMVILPRRPD